MSHYRRVRRKSLNAITDRRAVTPPNGTGHGGWLVPLLATSAAALGAAAIYNHRRGQTAEREHRPMGKFLDVNGVNLHYIERGHGPTVVLIHGNGTMVEDFVVSGIVERLAEGHRVIAIDRPGYGYSTRPRRLWTPRVQARLFCDALVQLGAEHAVVVGHSWGTLVAAALAFEAPRLVRGLVLVSGYYFPTVRADVALFSPAAIPVIGDVMRHTISPLVARLMLPGLVRSMFAPAAVTERFDREFPKELMLRPSQLRASAEDAAMMTPAVVDLQAHYGELSSTPLVIVAGRDDQIVDVSRHSERLHREVPDSGLVVVPGAGHMVHHLAPEQIIQAVAGVAAHSVGATGRDSGANFRNTMRAV